MCCQNITRKDRQFPYLSQINFWYVKHMNFFSLHKKIMLRSMWMCFLKSSSSSTLNDTQHMNFFALHKNSRYGQRASVFSSRSGLQLWMIFITWTFSLFIKNHVMVIVQVFSQVVVIFIFVWHSSQELFRSS